MPEETSAESAYEHILFDIEDGIATITLNRPEKMNAAHFPLLGEISAAYARCDGDDSVRAVILTGAGKAFCAGADMSGGDKTFKGIDMSRGESRRAGSGIRAYQIRKPVLAAINGHSVGVGMTLAMHCDLRFVAQDAKLAFSFVRRGIIPELGAHSILPRVIGFSRGADLLLSGRTFKGVEAAQLGIASEALPAADVLPRAREWARDVTANAAPASVAITKRLMWEGVGDTADEMIAKEAPLLAWVTGQGDAVEGVRSFLERRPPAWKLRPSVDLPDWPGEES